MTLAELEQVILETRAEAHSVCDLQGEADPHCRAAWDAVEEVLAARSHHQFWTSTSFEVYCQDHPSALECRVHDN